MRVAIGADWVGYQYKHDLTLFLESAGHEVIDMGGESEQANHYPIYAEKVSRAVIDQLVDCGILICGTGIGMSIASNKIKGIRAALCHDAFTTRLSRNHNNANVLCMGAWVVSIPHAKELVDLFIHSSYDGDRHVTRLDMINQIDDGFSICDRGDL